jgi:hypothetical protein
MLNIHKRQMKASERFISSFETLPVHSHRSLLDHLYLSREKTIGTYLSHVVFEQHRIKSELLSIVT